MHDRSAEDVLQGHVMAHHSVARGRKAPHSREGSRDVRDIEVADALRALIRKDECTSHEHRSRKNGCRKKRSPRSQCAELDANGASRKDSKQPDQPRTVDALVIADQMYLKDPDTMKVYSMTKDSIGDLVFIGHWNGVSIKKRRDHTSQDSLPSSLPSVAGSPLVELQTEFTVPHRRGTLQMLNFNVTDLADHCETCVEAYHDIKHVLMRLCKVRFY